MNADSVLEQIEPLPSAPPVLVASPHELLSRPHTRYTPTIASFWKELLAMYNQYVTPKIAPPSGRMIGPADVDVLEFLASPGFQFALAAERADDPASAERVVLQIRRASPDFVDVPPPGLEAPFVVAHLVANFAFFTPTPPADPPLHVALAGKLQLWDSELRAGNVSPVEAEALTKTLGDDKLLNAVAADVRIALGAATDDARQARVAKILATLDADQMGDETEDRFARKILRRIAAVDAEAARVFSAAAQADRDLEPLLARYGFRHARVLVGPVLDRIAATFDEAELFAWPPDETRFPVLRAALNHIVLLVNAGLREGRSPRQITIGDLPGLPPYARGGVASAVDADLRYKHIELRRDYPASHYRHLGRRAASIAAEVAISLMQR